MKIQKRDLTRLRTHRFPFDIHQTAGQFLCSMMPQRFLTHAVHDKRCCEYRRQRTMAMAHSESSSRKKENRVMISSPLHTEHRTTSHRFLPPSPRTEIFFHDLSPNPKPLQLLEILLHPTRYLPRRPPPSHRSRDLLPSNRTQELVSKPSPYEMNGTENGEYDN